VSHEEANLGSSEYVNLNQWVCNRLIPELKQLVQQG